MTKKIFLGVCALFLFQIAFANDSTKVALKTFAPEVQHPTLFQLIGQILNSYHYRKVSIDDKLSSTLLDNYIDNLDPAKVYFMQQDIDKFEAYRNQLDNDLLMGNVDKAFEIYNLYQTRLNDRIQYTFDLLNSEFDFTKNDSFLTDRDKATWCKSAREYDALWLAKTKSEALQLKADGKDFKSYSDILRKRYYNLLKQLAKTKNEDVFSFFANSLSEIADPHTNYFSPRAAEDFATSMSLSLEGIGATLQTENEYTKIREVVKGGPAERSKKLAANDKIVAVGQGKDGEMVSILDWRIDDVVSLIRGKKGTLVRLEIIPHDATSNKTEVIEIVRDKIVLADQGAKSSIKVIEKDGKKYKMGVVVLPTFYLDVAALQRGDENYKSTTRDVKKLIVDLKKENIDGLVIDLRNNGGGSLQEAVELTGLFISKGPVVAVKDHFGVTKAEEDRDGLITWDGPMCVLVNRFSASASEIFAAAIQDYDRGLVIGEKTYGKGTVQNLFDLNSFINIEGKKLGQLKLTIAKFYRISGGSTQFKGVIPDIEFPSIYADKDFGEGASEFALPYDEIKPQSYSSLGLAKKNLNEIQANHTARMDSSVAYRFLMEDIDNMLEARQRKYITLNEEKYKAELAIGEKKKKDREAQKAKLKESNPGEDNLILDESLQILFDQLK
ncbi:MAG: carboxy terminal-processing peptidase [Bacteroidia bacterium]|nr:carboxy terminal-processing peptidase [Bacteroidia bacterium]MCF8426056.1 carboxy terminal-processing peptidase [Bacteroidia bacterium]MCF8445349.1 carboxy terminal-processing peptidase [Bacteroidia bacterium]